MDHLGGHVQIVTAVKEEGWKLRTETLWRAATESFQQMLSFMFD